MNNFNENYKKLFDNINISDKTRKKLMTNQNEIYNKHGLSLFKTIIVSGLIIIFSLGVFFKNQIINAYKNIFTVSEKKEGKESSCIISLPIINIKNKKAYSVLKNKTWIKKEEIEKLLNVSILWNDSVENDMDILRIESNDKGLLAFITFKSSDYYLSKDYYNEVPSTSKINVSIGLLTKDAPEYMKDYNLKPSDNKNPTNKYYVSEFTNCDEDSFELHKLDNKIYLYINKNEFKTEDGKTIKMYVDNNKKIEKRIVAFFEHNGLLYKVSGEDVNKDWIIDFVKNMK